MSMISRLQPFSEGGQKNRSTRDGSLVSRKAWQNYNNYATWQNIFRKKSEKKRFFCFFHSFSCRQGKKRTAGRKKRTIRKTGRQEDEKTRKQENERTSNRAGGRSGGTEWDSFWFFSLKSVLNVVSWAKKCTETGGMGQFLLKRTASCLLCDARAASTRQHAWCGMSGTLCGFFVFMVAFLVVCYIYKVCHVGQR